MTVSHISSLTFINIVGQPWQYGTLFSLSKYGMQRTNVTSRPYMVWRGNFPCLKRMIQWLTFGTFSRRNVFFNWNRKHFWTVVGELVLHVNVMTCRAYILTARSVWCFKIDMSHMKTVTITVCDFTKLTGSKKTIYSVLIELQDI